jgi:hypothetical protein
LEPNTIMPRIDRGIQKTPQNQSAGLPGQARQ